MKRLILVAALMQSGCAFFTGADSEVLNDLELCDAYGGTNQIMARQTASARYKAEIVRRRLLTETEWESVEKRRIFVGMSECALYASWRRPLRQNRTVTSRVERIQHVYESFGTPYVRGTYVYTENGRVTAWQD